MNIIFRFKYILLLIIFNINACWFDSFNKWNKSQHINAKNFFCITIGAFAWEFILKNISKNLVARADYGTFELKEENQRRIFEIIKQNEHVLGRSFDKLKIKRMAEMLLFPCHAIALQNQFDEILSFRSDLLVESLTDEELKYIIFRELISLSDRYDKHSVLNRFCLSSFILYPVLNMYNYFTESTFENDPFNGIIIAITYVLLHWRSNVMFEKQKDDTYIKKFSNVQNLKAVVSYYNKCLTIADASTINKKYYAKKIEQYQLAVDILSAN